MNEPDLSVILVNWNASVLTKAALTSIKERTHGIEYETFVIDNGSTRDPDFAELPKRFPWITFIANRENLGFSKANNQGIRLARGRYVLLLNNDTIQTENALGEAVLYMDAHPEVGALGIAHLNNDAEKSPQHSHFNFPNPWTESAQLIGLKSRSVELESEQEAPQKADVDWICGSFLCVRRKCLEQVGELDESFFVYDEDVDWCRRARNAGWQIRFWPGASMIHVGSATKHLMKDKTFLHFRSHLTYYHKHHGFFAATFYYLAMGLRLTRATAWHLFRFLIGKGSYANFQERVWRQKQFLGLRAGKSGV